MKKITFIITAVLILSQLASYSQEDGEMRTLFSKDTSQGPNVYGGYGAPFVGATTLMDEPATIVGGKGGVIRNHSFVFGLVGGATIQNQSMDYIRYNVPASKKVWLGYGGVFFEYIVSYSSPIHFAIPLNLQVGGVSAGRDGDNLSVKSSSLMVIEPGISLEFNFSKYFVPALNVGYRYVTGSYTSNLSAIYATAIFKFGQF